MVQSIRHLLARCGIARSMRVALAVGVALTLINQGAVRFHRPWPAGLPWRLGLNFLVPFLVATYSAYRAQAQ